MIRILVADDHQVVRAGVKAVLAAETDFAVVAEASDCPSALDAALRLSPDILLLDLELSGDGLSVLGALRAHSSATRVLVLSMHGDGGHVRRALDAGADGYVVKGAGVEALVSALRTVMKGQRFLDPVAERALREPVAPADEAWERLTPRERLVLRRVAEGRTNKEIAGELALSHKTVDSHRTNLMRKLGLKDAQGVTRFAMRRGLLAKE